MNYVKIVGLDLGRGYVKAVSNGSMITFPSVIKHETGCLNDRLDGVDGRFELDIDGVGQYTIGEDAVHISLSHGYSTDSKVDEIAQVLFWSALSKLFQHDKYVRVNVMLGVPHDMLSKPVLDEIKKTYLGKSKYIKNITTGFTQQIEINKISISSEAVAAGVHIYNQNPQLKKEHYGVATIGYRTTELAFFMPNFKYQPKMSKNIELGNIHFLSDIARNIGTKLNDRQLDIVENSKLSKEKDNYYSHTAPVVADAIKKEWKDYDDIMDIYVVGGTAIHLQPYLGSQFKFISNSQTVVSSGLFLLAQYHLTEGD